MTIRSICDGFHSWTYLHNKTGKTRTVASVKVTTHSVLTTVKIFSHVIGMLMYLSIPAYIFNTEIPLRHAVATWADKTVCCIYFIGMPLVSYFQQHKHLPHPP